MASTDKVHLNLDTTERDEEFEPFVVSVNGKALTLNDPAEMDYQQLIECETPLQWLKYTMTQEDRDHLAVAKLKAWRLGKLMDGYMAHFKTKERVDTREKLGF